MSPAILERARRLLCALQDHIRDTLRRTSRGSRDMARIAAVTAADTIYAIDRISEDAICAWFDAHWPKAWSVELVMEGLEDGSVTTFPRGTPVEKTVFKCILDPIDGTRGLMYDKRSAWILAGLAPQRGARTHLGDIVVAAMTELPTSKQGMADQLSAVRGAGLRCTRLDLASGRRTRFVPRPATGTDCRHGFASFVRFFPEGRVLMAQLEESLWDELYGVGRGVSPIIFDDQYISTDGQLYEIIVGHDRLIGDLRPLVFKKLGLRAELSCHPYDIGPAFLLKEAGGVIERPEGGPLCAPLDTTTPVAWIGYANPALARKIRPILRRLIGEKLS